VVPLNVAELDAIKTESQVDPDTVTAVDDAFANVVWPVTERMFDASDVAVTAFAVVVPVMYTFPFTFAEAKVVEPSCESDDVATTPPTVEVRRFVDVANVRACVVEPTFTF
jgi:hypothetical protein